MSLPIFPLFETTNKLSYLNTPNNNSSYFNSPKDNSLYLNQPNIKTHQMETHHIWTDLWQSPNGIISHYWTHQYDFIHIKTHQRTTHHIWTHRCLIWVIAIYMQWVANEISAVDSNRYIWSSELSAVDSNRDIWSSEISAVDSNRDNYMK